MGFQHEEWGGQEIRRKVQGRKSLVVVKEGESSIKRQKGVTPQLASHHYCAVHMAGRQVVTRTTRTTESVTFSINFVYKIYRIKD